MSVTELTFEESKLPRVPVWWKQAGDTLLAVIPAAELLPGSSTCIGPVSASGTVDWGHDQFAKSGSVAEDSPVVSLHVTKASLNGDVTTALALWVFRVQGLATRVMVAVGDDKYTAAP